MNVFKQYNEENGKMSTTKINEIILIILKLNMKKALPEACILHRPQFYV